eukprot:TRINITY_DN146_c0_g1_i1.p1 TRINITY_DN146_c0_g1~~TRINITY_DN146_c0_g1_i1.p1  ORF type:complete len:379 (-),score=39.47 TRINITY_DN146_c0_g1_i1:263-1399(-)
MSSGKTLDEAHSAVDKVVLQFKVDLKKEYEKIEKDVADEKTRRLKTVDKEIAQKKQDLEEEWKRLEAEKKQLKEDRESLEHEIKLMEEVHTMQKGQVKLDVGGHMFSTSVTTLTKEHGSMLAAMFSGRHEIVKNDEGRVFIDRDGRYFNYILEYLRDGEWDQHMLSDPVMYAKVQKEANYFALEFPEAPESPAVSRVPKDAFAEVSKGLAFVDLAKVAFTWSHTRKGPHIVLSNSNKTASTTTAWNQVQAEQPIVPGSYFEVTINSVCATNRNLFGIVLGIGPANITLSGSNAIIGYNNQAGYGYVCNNGTIFPSSAFATAMTTASARDVIKCALSSDNTLTFSKNNVVLCSFKVAVTTPPVIFYPTVAIAEGQVTLS